MPAQPGEHRFSPEASSSPGLLWPRKPASRATRGSRRATEDDPVRVQTPLLGYAAECAVRAGRDSANLVSTAARMTLGGRCGCMCVQTAPCPRDRDRRKSRDPGSVALINLRRSRYVHVRWPGDPAGQSGQGFTRASPLAGHRSRGLELGAWSVGEQRWHTRFLRIPSLQSWAVQGAAGKAPESSSHQLRESRGQGEDGDPNTLRPRLAPAPFLGTGMLVCPSVFSASLPRLFSSDYRLRLEPSALLGAVLTHVRTHARTHLPHLQVGALGPSRCCARSSVAAGTQTPPELLALTLPQTSRPERQSVLFKRVWDRSRASSTRLPNRTCIHRIRFPFSNFLEGRRFKSSPLSLTISYPGS